MSDQAMEREQFVYVLSNPSMPGIYKIGRTENLEARLSSLFSTGVPTPFVVEFCAKVKDHAAVESALHVAFSPERIHLRREFFRTTPDRVIAILNLLKIGDLVVENTNTFNKEDQELLEAGRQLVKRRPPLDFEEMGIPVGATLEFVPSEASVQIVSNRKVRLGDEEMSLTQATRSLLKLAYSVAPGPHWTYQGKNLRAIYNETYPLTDE
jgi:hypothetical protein